MAKIESPRELFVNNLGSTLTMENEILEMLEELQEEARDQELKQNLAHHHQETQQQIRNLERVFDALGEEPKGQSCPPIEGLEKDGQLHPLQEAFLKADAMQCGYCTSGMIMDAVGLLNKNARPTRDEIVRHMDHNICRCGTYQRIVKAIELASGNTKEVAK